MSASEGQRVVPTNKSVDNFVLVLVLVLVLENLIFLGRLHEGISSTSTCMTTSTIIRMADYKFEKGQ